VSLTPGTRLGSYEVAAQIGAGGMGEVYRARDAKLDRHVALKVLPAALAQDPERLARFEREARTLAQLNHPNIGAIYGVEDSTATKALVMELVDGPTLADRIAQAPVPVDEALPIVRQLADALEAAHEQGIIHRDLKPANIKVRPDGTVKVLDFGLAKALDPAGAAAMAGVSQLATITTPAMTQAGVILGTAAYMSPEQARGKPLDRRTDLWAFGCVLYEMLTGHRAFDGETVTDVLGAVLRAEPDWQRLPPETPPAITTLIRRCLRKDARQRLADASTIRLEIDDAIAAPGLENGASSAARVAPTSSGARQISLAAAAALGAAIAVAAATAGVMWQGRAPERPAGTLARVTVPLPSDTTLATGPAIALAPDGSTLAFAATRNGIAELYVRRLAESEPRVIKDSRGAAAPFFSPDSEWVGFFVGAAMKRVSMKTGVMTTIAESALPAAEWGPGDRIINIAEGGALLVIPAAGGAPQRVRLKGLSEAASIRSASWLPGGQAVLVAASFTPTPSGDTAVAVVTLDTGDVKILVERGSNPLYLSTGHVVFVEDGTLKAVGFNPSTRDISGVPVEVLPGVRQQTYTQTAAFSCSATGTCAYIAGGTTRSRTIVMVDRSGTSRPLGVPRNSYAHPRFSPSGDRLAWWIEQRDCELETYDLARGTVERLKPVTDSHYPTWMPDGRSISLTGRRDASPYGLYSVATDGSGKVQTILADSHKLTPNASMSWTPDRVLVFVDKGDLWVLRPGDSEPTVLERTPGREVTPAFSHDGRWLAYASDEGGKVDVYVRPFPGAGEKFVISNGGGTEPVWARSGRELFFRNGDRFMVVDVGTGSAFSAGRPRLMFTMHTQSSLGRTSYDVSPDGQTFVMTDSGEEDRAAEQVMLLQNWFGELKRLTSSTSAGSN